MLDYRSYEGVMAVMPRDESQPIVDEDVRVIR